jgi:hypothetical protein
MVLQSTGPIGLSNVKAEFQGNEPISLAQYYQNAANGFTSNVAGIPNIGASINIAAFYGKTKAAAAAAFSAYVFTTHTFTNATATGRNGPTLAQCRSAYSGASWASSTTNFNVTTQGIQLWTVPATASYTITCAGAVGGNKIFTGFAGIVSRGTYALTEGTVVTIVVGQRGLNAGASGGGGGGGGSYVIYNATALIVGGGGRQISRQAVQVCFHQVGTVREVPQRITWEEAEVAILETARHLGQVVAVVLHLSTMLSEERNR